MVFIGSLVARPVHLLVDASGTTPYTDVQRPLGLRSHRPRFVRPPILFATSAHTRPPRLDHGGKIFEYMMRPLRTGPQSPTLSVGLNNQFSRASIAERKMGSIRDQRNEDEHREGQTRGVSSFSLEEFNS